MLANARYEKSWKYLNKWGGGKRRDEALDPYIVGTLKEREKHSLGVGLQEFGISEMVYIIVLSIKSEYRVF